MKSGGKIRIVVSIAIMMVLAYFATGLLYELYRYAIKHAMIDTGVKDIIIDGADFTPIFRLLGAGINAVFEMIMTGIYAGAILLTGLILLIPFRIIGLNKKRCIQRSEYKLVKYAYIIVLVLSFLSGGVITRFSMLIPLFLLNVIWGLLAFLLCVLPLKKRSSNSDAGDNRDAEAGNHGTAG